jgi:hypothetical protein
MRGIKLIGRVEKNTSFDVEVDNIRVGSVWFSKYKDMEKAMWFCTNIRGSAFWNRSTRGIDYPHWNTKELAITYLINVYQGDESND